MQLRIQLIGESESMLRYAFGRGMEIPEAIQEMADLLERTSDHNEPFNTSLIDLIKLHDQLAKPTDLGYQCSVHCPTYAV